jgi:hypothetical protein
MLHIVKPAAVQASAEDLQESLFYQWQDLDPETIEPRRWLYGRHYLAGAVSATIADGGVGKSILALTEAIAMATMRPLLGIKPWRHPEWESSARLEVFYYNAEESLEELQRRVIAICQHYEIDLNELMPKHGGCASLTLMSGHDYPLVIGTSGKDGVTFTDHVEFLNDCEVDVIILDPLVSIHGCPENDNSAIDAIVKRLGRIAVTGCIKAVELVHHARKPAQGGTIEISGNDARGASAVFDGVRSLRTLNRMTEAEALRAKVEDHRSYFRADGGKANYAAGAAESEWYRHQSVLLPNGDDVGVVVPWHMPGAFDGVTSHHMRQVRDLARSGQYRADQRSPDWIGGAVADALDLDTENEGDRKRIKVILKAWFAEGVIKKDPRPGPDRQHVHVRQCRRVGRAIAPFRHIRSQLRIRKPASDMCRQRHIWLPPTPKTILRELLFWTPARLPQTPAAEGECGSAGVRGVPRGDPDYSRNSCALLHMRDSRTPDSRTTPAKRRNPWWTPPTT